MMDFQPAWLTDELNKKLNRLKGQHQRKKRNTVLHLARAAAEGDTQDDVWAMPECCSRTCWEGKYKDGERLPGWRDDPDIQAALAAATDRANWWRDTAEARRIADRMEKLAQARDKLAEYSPLAVERLFVLMGTAGNEETRRRAANDILDRADEGTATKTVTTESGDHEQRIKLDLADLPSAILQQVLDALESEGADRSGDPGGTE